jgi:hypothetical protein
MEGLAKTLNTTNANQATKGFVGDSLGANRLRLEANTQMGDRIAATNVQNAGDLRTIQDQDLAQKIASVGLPAQVAANNMAMLRMPGDNFFQQQSAAQGPLNFFRVGTGQPYQYQNLPQVQPIPGAGQLALQGIGQLAGAGANYNMNMNLANKWGSIMNSRGGGGGGGGWNTNPMNTGEFSGD